MSEIRSQSQTNRPDDQMGDDMRHPDPTQPKLRRAAALLAIVAVIAGGALAG
jgi:hypothetical protein